MDIIQVPGKDSFLAKVRTATRRLEPKLRVSWAWSPEEQVFVLKFANNTGMTSIAPSGRDRITSVLRRRLSTFFVRSLTAKPDQGKVFQVTTSSNFPNHFLRTGRSTRFCDWRFVHRARLGVLPLNACRRWETNGDKRCQKCGYQQETIPHVLAHCGVHSAARQRRHNNVQDRLVKAASRCPGVIRVNQTMEGVAGEAGTLRPDIVVRDEVNRTITIVDVAVPFENGKIEFAAARARKFEKYGPLATQLAASGYTVRLDAFIVGSLGGWDHHNDSLQQHLRVGRYYAGMMRKFLVSDTVRWSRDIYVEHVSGRRQYQ
ncbi:uncharacterized protein [Neodiprion pinetum]|uniref:uncharacterized protein n=1 Tax=Neodiprion pinetum TaxID=441929 RepID=UPI0037112803